MFNLFIDDVRDSHEAFFRKHKSFAVTDWVVVRSVEDAISLIKQKGVPNFISFDYDLEQGYTLSLIDFLEENKEKIPKGFDYDVHSTNKHGVKIIKERMDLLLNQNSHWDY